jgi:hypothetical protein
MEILIQQLFAARDIAHRLHLRVRSFSQHMALGDLYEALVDAADEIAEIHQGKHGLMNLQNPIFTFSDQDPIIFIRELAQWAENTKSILPPESHIHNEWDNVISTIYRAKYKLENLA